MQPVCRTGEVNPSMRHPESAQLLQLMSRFWNAKASENAPFYIATWRGYRRRDLDGFFLTVEEVSTYLRDAGYHNSPGDRMLEIGCGIGRMTRGFAGLFGEVYAVDVSGEMIRRAKSNTAGLANVRLFETNGGDLSPFCDLVFDFCFSFLVFQHIPSRPIVENYIRETARVLKAGGMFRFQVNGLPDPDSRTNRFALLAKRAYRRFVRRPLVTLSRRVTKKPHGFESPAWTGVALTEEDVRLACSRAGLEVLEMSGVGTRYMWTTARKSGSCIVRRAGADRQAACT